MVFRAIDARPQDFLSRPVEGDRPYLRLDSHEVRARAAEQIVWVGAKFAVVCHHD